MSGPKVLLLLAAALVVGCAVDQKKEVSLYRRVLDPAAASTQPAFAPDQALSLRQALDLANQHNEQLSQRGEDYLQALIDKDRAVANFLPTIDLAPTYFVQDPTRNTSSVNAKTHRLDVPVRGQMSLFNGFRDVANFRAAEATIEQRRAELLDLQAATLLDVARVYYQILRSERSVEVLRNSIEVQQARVRDIRGRQNAGVARPLDVAQIEAQAAATSVALIQAQSDVRNGRSVLAFLINAPVASSPLTDDFDLPADLPAVESLLDRARQSRYSIAAARAATTAARQRVESAIGQYYPSVALDLDYFLKRDSNPSDSEWNGMISANLPIFSAGRIHADVRTAWSQFRQAQLAESIANRQVEQDVRVAHENFLTAGQRLNELEAQLAAARESLRQAEQSYQVGLATNLERVTAQDAVLSAELQLVSAQFDRKLSYLELQRAVGSLRP